MSRILTRSAIFAALVGVVLAGCKRTSTDQWPDKPGPKVAVSFAPNYCAP